MENRTALEQQLDTARLVLEVLERQAAGYTTLTIPAHLQVELEQKRKEVQSLEERLAQLGGRGGQVINNVPNRPAIFVGRQAEVARCLEALEPEERGWGVAIDGIGGMGKTALALEVAHRTQQQAWFDAYLFVSAKTTWLSHDGVRKETLAHSSLDAFIREFARLLGDNTLSHIDDATARRVALLDALRGRRVLLILDNLETLTLEEQGMVAEFLRKLPGSNKAIITSRRRTGESALTVRLDRLTFLEAEQLMTEVGQYQINVARELSKSTLELRLTLYEAAGGNPLALRWTLGLAAQMGYTLIQAISRLQNAARSVDLYNFLFTDAVRNLTTNGRSILTTLVTFQTYATPTILSSVSGLARTEVEIALEQLITLSLINDLGDERYTMHPLTRRFAHAALTDTLGFEDRSLDPSDYRKALRYWVDYAKQNGGDRKKYALYPALDTQWPNLEATADTLRELAGITESTGENTILWDYEAARLLNDLAEALFPFLRYHGYWTEQIQIGAWAYSANLALSDWRNAGLRAYQIAWIYCSRGDIEHGSIWAERTKIATTRGGNRRDQASAMRLQGIIAEQSQQAGEAEQFYKSTLVMFRELGAESDLSPIFNDLGRIVRAQGRNEEAEAYNRQALDLAIKTNDLEGQASYLADLGHLALDQERQSEAYSWYKQSLEIGKQIGRQDQIAQAQIGLAKVLESETQYAEALNYAYTALQIGERMGHRDLVKTRDLVARLRQRAE